MGNPPPQRPSDPTPKKLVVAVCEGVGIGEEITPRSTAWQEQWKRVLRYYRRLAGPARGRTQLECLDDAYNFFVASWHMADAIAHSLTFPDTATRKQAYEKQVLPAALQHEALSICHDIATAYKHVSASRPKASGTPQLIPGSVTINPETVLPDMDSVRAAGSVEVRPRFEHDIIADDGSRRSAAQVAREAIAAWRAVLETWGWTPP